MNRLVLAASLSIAGLLLLTSCTSDDDPFPVHPAARTEADAPVAGAETPAPNGSGSWKW